jgi:hypothetical protein
MIIEIAALGAHLSYCMRKERHIMSLTALLEGLAIPNDSKLSAARYAKANTQEN